MSAPRDIAVVRVDIVSDVVCPWCIIGFKQLERALARAGLGAALRWHPFELNPDMPPAGQNLREHLIGKYAITEKQSEAARARLTALSKDLGFAFAYSDDMRMVNTFRAHQLLDWAAEQGRQHALKLALFRAFFTEGRDVSAGTVLIAAAGAAGLDSAAARLVLASGSHAAGVRGKQKFWTDRGIQGVPAMVFDGRYLLTGAQGADIYGQVLQRCRDEAARRLSPAAPGRYGTP